MFLVDKSIISYGPTWVQTDCDLHYFNAEKIQNFQTGFERQRTA